MERRKKILIIIVSIGVLLLLTPIIALLLFSINKDNKYTKTTIGKQSTPMYYRDEMAVAPYESNSIETSKSLDTSSVDRTKIIKTGNISKLVDDFNKSEEEIREISEKNDGEVMYLVDVGEGNRRVLNMEIKIPVENFDKVFSTLKEMEGENISSSIDMRDVTKEVMDLEARLKTSQNTEAQLLEILKKADTVTDTISVYKELNEIRANIESIQSQLDYYSNKTDYSTIRITLKQSSTGATLEDTPWKPLGVLKDASRAYISFLKVFVTLAIYILVFTAPIWVIYGIFRIVKKSSGK
ncbi:MAG: DUF4349 domain-containing protein [Candidatus Dojkabacteria bacterium]|jgi:hypothetical protein